MTHYNIAISEGYSVMVQVYGLYSSEIKYQETEIIFLSSVSHAISMIIVYLISVNTFTLIEKACNHFCNAQVEKLLIGQKYKSYKTVQGVIAH